MTVKTVAKAFVFLLIFVAVNYYFYVLYQAKINPPTPSPVVIIPSPAPTQAITAPSITVWSDLRFAVQNGTTKTGYASLVAAKFTSAGITDVATGNADNKNYPESKLIFKDVDLQTAYQSKIIAIHPVSVSNVTINKNISSDVILILGTN